MRGATSRAPAPTMSGNVNVNGLSKPPVRYTSVPEKTSARTPWSGPRTPRNGVFGTTSWRRSRASPVTAMRIMIPARFVAHIPLAAAKTATAIRNAQLTIRMIRSSSVGSGTTWASGEAGSRPSEASSVVVAACTTSSLAMALGSSAPSVLNSCCLPSLLARRRIHPKVGAISKAIAVTPRTTIAASTISEVVGIHRVPNW